MPEAYAARSQRKGEQSLLDVAHGAGMCVMASASLLQSRLVRAVPPELLDQLGTPSGAQAALQFVRSTPGIAAALAGMRQLQHVEENLALRKVAPVDLRKGPLGAAP
jgi:predicted aldo/keto reductase-like oxidoreductase